MKRAFKDVSSINNGQLVLSPSSTPYCVLSYDPIVSSTQDVVFLQETLKVVYLVTFMILMLD